MLRRTRPRVGLKWLPAIVSLAFVCLPVSAAVRPAHPQSKSRHSSHHSRTRHAAHAANSGVRTRASLRTVSFRTQATPARTSSQTSTSSKSTTASKKKRTTRQTRTARRGPVQKAPTPDRISEIQSALARGGYYQGDPNGKWDPSTVAALQKFQSANGLDSSGKLDALSLQKMGLGSEIAGVSAPRPVVHPSGASAPSGAALPPGSAATVPSSDFPSSAGSSTSDSTQR